MAPDPVPPAPPAPRPRDLLRALLREAWADSRHGDGRATARWLIAGNLLTLVLAFAQGWSLGALLWPYWLQSVAIGAFNVRRILALKAFSTEGMSSGGAPVPATRAAQVGMATFFCVHYGMFHLVYMMFLFAAPASGAELPWLAACGVALWLAQWRAHRAEVAADARGSPRLGMLMFAPYVRVLPMHLVIIFGIGFAGGGGFAMLLFGVLKTLADLAAHAIEQRLVAGAGQAAR
jgi:hypothetical protein